MLPSLSLLFCILVLSFCCAAADLYSVLGVHKKASDADIRKAYKDLSRKHHPDKNKDKGAGGKFVEIARAYEVLSDLRKRQIYDLHGEEGLKAHEGGQQHANPFDMFTSFFGGHMYQEQIPKGPTSTVEFDVSLSDMYKGASIDFIKKKSILCDHCRGTGAASDGDIHACSGCGGTGMKITRQQIWPGMFAQSQATCNECGGRGQIIVKKCPNCGGNKIIDYTAHYTLEVPRGMPEGYEVVFEGEGDESPDWEPGDLILRVRSQREHGGWRRKESSLYWRQSIGIDEALLGFERNITHLDGHAVTLKRDGVTQPGFVQMIKGEGMPVYQNDAIGDLFVEYNVILPSELTPSLRKKLENAFKGKNHGKDEL